MKKYIAVAVAGALLSPLSFAEVKLTGQVGAAYTFKSFQEKGKNSQADFGNWGSKITLEGTQEIDEVSKLKWSITQSLKWDDKATGSVGLGSIYLDFSFPFGEIRLGRFGRVSYPYPSSEIDVYSLGREGKTTGLIRYTTPNFLTGNDSFKVSFTFSPKGGEKVADGKRPIHGYFLDAKYVGDFAESGKLTAGYKWSKIDDADNLGSSTSTSTTASTSTSTTSNPVAAAVNAIPSKKKVSNFFGGPQSHYIYALYETAKVDDAFLSVGGFFKYTNGLYDKKNDTFLHKTENSAKDGYVYAKQNEYGIYVAYDTGLGLVPSFNFVKGTDHKSPGSSTTLKDTGYTSYSIETTYAVTKNITTLVGFGVSDPAGNDNRETNFKVGIKATF